jgi:hypothetical protein
MDTHFFSKETKQKLVYAAGLLVQKKQKLARKLEQGKKSIETYKDIFPQRIKNVQDVIRSLINACNEEDVDKIKAKVSIGIVDSYVAKGLPLETEQKEKVLELLKAFVPDNESGRPKILDIISWPLDDETKESMQQTDVYLESVLNVVIVQALAKLEEKTAKYTKQLKRVDKDKLEMQLHVQRISERIVKYTANLLMSPTHCESDKNNESKQQEANHYDDDKHQATTHPTQPLRTNNNEESNHPESPSKVHRNESNHLASPPNVHRRTEVEATDGVKVEGTSVAGFLKKLYVANLAVSLDKAVGDKVRALNRKCKKPSPTRVPLCKKRKITILRDEASQVYQQSRASQGNDLAQDLLTEHCCSLLQSIKEQEQDLKDEGDEIKVLSPATRLQTTTKRKAKNAMAVSPGKAGITDSASTSKIESDYLVQGLHEFTPEGYPKHLKSPPIKNDSKPAAKTSKPRAEQTYYPLEGFVQLLEDGQKLDSTIESPLGEQNEERRPHVVQESKSSPLVFGSKRTLRRKKKINNLY